MNETADNIAPEEQPQEHEQQPQPENQSTRDIVARMLEGADEQPESEEVEDELQEEAEAEPVEGGDEEPEIETTTFQPHGDFTEDEKAALQAFYESDPEGAAALNGKVENLIKGFHDKAQKASGLEKELAGFNTLFEPMDGWLKSQGYTRESYTHNLMTYAHKFSNDPRGFIEQLADESGIAVTFEDEDEVDTEKAELKRKVSEYERSQQTNQQTQLKQQQDAFLQKATAHFDKKDADGKPVYPHVDKVFNDMMVFIDRDNLNKFNFSENEWEAAYKKAVKLNDLDTAPAKAATQESDIEKRKRVAQARKNSKSVSTTRNPSKPARYKTTREAVEAVYEKRGL